MVKSIDIFCHVVDNFGDIGVVYRFARELRFKLPSCVIRLFVDDLATFTAIEPRIAVSVDSQELDSVQYIRTGSITSDFIDIHGSAEIIIEAFGCEIPDNYMDKACTRSLLWINLEHLSGEDWVGGYHCKESLMGKGTIRKFFFMPGFTTDTGGVITDSHVEMIKNDPWKFLQEYLETLAEPFSLKPSDLNNARIGTIFSYARNFSPLLKVMAGLDKEFFLFVFGEKSQCSMRSALDEIRAVKLNDRHWITGSAHILFTPFLPQRQYDALLCLADFNIVRGEDSLVRAIMAGRPFIWHAYIQDKGYQIVKVEAFLKKMRVYFKDEEVFRKYYELMIEFNRPASEKASQEMTGNENFLIFFDDLEKIKHACTGMSYFMKRKCNLIDNFIQFIDLYTNSRMKQQT